MVHVNSVNKSKNKQPWKFIYQNIRALVSENSRAKIDFFREYLTENKTIILNFTETWLNETIKEEATIENYNLFRGDRKDTTQGGTAIYLYDKIEGELIESFSENKCEMVAIKVPSLNLINIVSYRPPHTKMSDFKPMLNKITNILNKLDKPDPTIIWSGDFNFPFVNWKECNAGGCTWNFNPDVNSTVDERDQFRSIMDLCCKLNLMQIIDEPTREKNTLDLIFTNELDIFSHMDINHSILSDHHLIELTSTFKTERFEETLNLIAENNGLRNYNFFSKKVKWKEIKNELNNKNWEELFKDKNTCECTEILNRIVNEICIKYVPLKGAKRGKRFTPKERKRLIGRLKMLKKGKKEAFSNEKKENLDEKIMETEKLIIEAKRKEKIEKERAITESIPKNPKLLFSYSKKENNRVKEIGPFKKGNELVYTGEEICNMLVEEYKKQLIEKTTNPNPDLIHEITQINDDDLSDIIFDEGDLNKAIGKLRENSGPGPDDIPAIFLIETREEIVEPLKLILRKSIDNTEIPDIYKLAHITPIHKGGKKCKFMPENYRPVSLTSHIMKIYERIIAKNIIEHLTKNHMFNKNQHGFVPGKSTQTQLLAYYKDIYDILQKGTRIDTVFLDFARAFDKVDHEILLQKIVKHKIKGKVACWIREFLNNRKFKVLANKTMSEEVDVTSGVPQGTVLAAILFLIMISDIDEEVKDSIVRSFADDTRVSKEIRNEGDQAKMQADLDVIYEWATNNKMKFNSDKFEKISHGEITGLPIENYKNPEGIDITSDNTVRDLGVTCNNDLNFKEHIDEIVAKSKMMSGMLMRTFITRERNVMLQLFKTYIRSRLEYCSIVWSPTTQEDINKIERLQKSFTANIDGMEKFNYHERLKELKLYSLERRRERYLIIYAWEQIEGLRENILNLRVQRWGRKRRIIQGNIPWAINGKKLRKLDRTRIFNSTEQKMARLFNHLPTKIANLSGVTTETFKKRLDEWLMKIPDQPKIDDYAGLVERETNSLLHQAVTLTEV